MCSECEKLKQRVAYLEKLLDRLPEAVEKQFAESDSQSLKEQVVAIVRNPEWALQWGDAIEFTISAPAIKTGTLLPDDGPVNCGDPEW